MKRILAGLFGVSVLGLGAAMAAAPVDGGLGLVPSASALADEVHFFHNVILLPIITAISLFVLALLLWIIVRYNAKANPTPRKFSHNTMIEVVWTVVPIFILLAIALPSFDLLYKGDVIPDGKQTVAEGDGATRTFAFANEFQPSRMVRRDAHLQVFLADDAGERRVARGDYSVEGFGEPEVLVTLDVAPSAGQRVVIRGGRSLVGAGGFGEDRREIAMSPTMTIKVNGFQWGWMYSYPDFGDFEFTSNPLSKEQAQANYLFEVDNRVVVPVGETIRVVTTARDVIHSWALPNFAIKIDAVPGRLNETWFAARQEGVYYGQCSEICGVRHSYMPIAVEVVSREAFEAWVDEQRELAGLDPMFADGRRFAQSSVDGASAE